MPAIAGKRFGKPVRRNGGNRRKDPEDYASIWNYTKGETEPRFSLYEYPDFPFRTTDKMSNLSIKE